MMPKKWTKTRNRVVAALALFAVLFALEHIIPLESRLIWFLLYLVPYLLAGSDVVRKAVLGIKNGQMFDESFLMTLATIGAFVTGENSEACAVMLFYQVGELFQGYAVGKSRNSITELMNIVPEYAYVERPDGTIDEIDPDDVEVGDILVIRAGDKIPVDGTVLDGQSMIDTAALTGEPVPRSAKPGDTVISGCINGEGVLKIRADKTYDDSTVVKILELVENAASKKSRTEKFITRFARYYTPAVVILALALAIIPSIIFRNPMTWIYRACTFLVISCPCALVISIPLAYFGGIGAASRSGVLVKGSNYLEALANLDTLVSDKTGTLTKGEFKVNRVIPAEGITQEQVLQEAAKAEALSTHPIAISICDAAGEKSTAEITESENITGRGQRVVIQGDTILVGNGLLMKEHGIAFEEAMDPASTIVYVAKNQTYLGAILISDAPKECAAEAISALKKEGVRRIVMLTGDRKEAAEAVGNSLGVDETHGQLLPGDKVEKVEAFLAELGVAQDKEGDNSKRKTLAFIGDGINDAPVLSRADVGIAMGSLGSDAAIEAADIVIMDDDLRKIPTVLRISRKTMNIAKQNIVFALGVKFLILVLGALGVANMWAAVFADVGVAILCILNSMRLLIPEKSRDN